MSNLLTDTHIRAAEVQPGDVLDGHEVVSVRKQNDSFGLTVVDIRRKGAPTLNPRVNARVSVKRTTGMIV